MRRRIVQTLLAVWCLALCAGIGWLIREQRDMGGLVRGAIDRGALAQNGVSEVLLNLAEGAEIVTELPDELEASWTTANGTTHTVRSRRKAGETTEAFEGRHDEVVARRQLKFPPKPVAPPTGGQ